MKNRNDPRHKRRRQTIQHLFEWWFFHHQAEKQQEVLGRIRKRESKLTFNILEHQKEIDQAIGQAAKDWPIEGIAKVDLNILRLAAYELLYGHTAPVKVIVDEAVELAKELGGETSPAFVNGVLGKIITVYEPSKS